MRFRSTPEFGSNLHGVVSRQRGEVGRVGDLWGRGSLVGPEVGLAAVLGNWNTLVSLGI